MLKHFRSVEGGAKVQVNAMKASRK